jgi:hypothetical protein
MERNSHGEHRFGIIFSERSSLASCVGPFDFSMAEAIGQFPGINGHGGGRTLKPALIRQRSRESKRRDGYKIFNDNMINR